MKNTLLISACAALVSIGCGQKESAPSAPAPASPMPSVSTETEAPPPPVPTASAETPSPAATTPQSEPEVLGRGDLDMEFYESQLNAYFGETGKIPASFQDLVAAGFLERAPVAPAGKRIAIVQDKSKKTPYFKLTLVDK